MLHYELVRRWLLGAIGGTLLIAATSPWFVRSYVPREFSFPRNAVVLSENASYRWRSEGYADTAIGPHGIPGWPVSWDLDEPAQDGILRIALWGDSQAEGMCVQDSDKIASLVEEFSHGQTQVATLARSGDDCNDWIAQLSVAEKTMHLDAHVFLLVEWSDWCIDAADPQESVSYRINAVTRFAPGFVIHALRNATTQGATNEPRQLRFGLGPIDSNIEQSSPGKNNDLNGQAMIRLANQIDRLRASTSKPLVFLYAPQLPRIRDGKIQSEDDSEKLLVTLQESLSGKQSTVVDVRSQLIDSAMSGRWPRGFHHGQFGVGHYNAIGNAILARSCAVGLSELAPLPRATESP